MEVETRNKISEKLKGNKNHLGKNQSENSRIKIKLANEGYKWYNDGTTEVKAKTCPAGFTKGRLKTKKWYANNETEVYATSKPSNDFVRGKRITNNGKKWYNDGRKNFLLEEEPTSELMVGLVMPGMHKKLHRKIEESKPVVGAPSITERDEPLIVKKNVKYTLEQKPKVEIKEPAKFTLTQIKGYSPSERYLKLWDKFKSSN